MSDTTPSIAWLFCAWERHAHTWGVIYLNPVNHPLINTRVGNIALRHEESVLKLRTRAWLPLQQQLPG
jgi:hypothetical protein